MQHDSSRAIENTPLYSLASEKDENATKRPNLLITPRFCGKLTPEKAGLSLGEFRLILMPFVLYPHERDLNRRPIGSRVHRAFTSAGISAGRSHVSMAERKYHYP